MNACPLQVKSNTVYETIRLLGRGAFGDVNLGTAHPSIRVHIYPSVCTSIRLPSVCPFVCLSIYLCACLSIHPSAHPSTLCLSVCSCLASLRLQILSVISSSPVSCCIVLRCVESYCTSNLCPPSHYRCPPSYYPTLL